MIIKNGEYKIGCFTVSVTPNNVTISSLNTLLQESPFKVALLKSFLSFGKSVVISWSCSGHSRASWQSQCDYDHIKSNYPDFDVILNRFCVLVSPAKKSYE